MTEVSRTACAPATKLFIQALQARLKLLFAIIKDFDGVGIDEHSAKLDSCLVNDVAYDGLLAALFLLSMAAASSIAQHIFESCEMRTVGADFEVSENAGSPRDVQMAPHTGPAPTTLASEPGPSALRIIINTFFESSRCACS